MKKIFVSDITLKELAEQKDFTLLFREKTSLAKCIDSFGADSVELPEIKNIKEDTIVYRTISSVVENSFVCVPVGFTKESLNNAWECVKDAAKPCLQVSLPVSTVQMEYSYHLKSNKMLLKIEELCTFAKEKCEFVQFTALDATRADDEFLKEACITAEKCGVCAVTLCDDAGVMLPDEFAGLVKKIKSVCNIPIYVKTSDNINLAVASAVAAVCAGADGVKTAVTGKNVLLTDKFADVVSARGESLDICTNLDITKIHRDIKDMLKNFNNNSVSGTGLSDNGQTDIFLDSTSSLTQLCDAVKTLGYDLSDDDCGKVYRALMRVCEKKSFVGAKELEAIVASSAMQVPSTYHVKSYNTVSGNLISAMSSITLKKNDEELSGVSIGDGPIDASFRAIEAIVGYHYELDDFQIHSVTEGKESIGSAFVRLRSDGKLYSGNGLSTDIVGASIRAYINALNKIVFEEN